MKKFCTECLEDTDHVIDLVEDQEYLICTNCNGANGFASSIKEVTYTRTELDEMFEDVLKVMKRKKSKDFSEYHAINNINFNEGVDAAVRRMKVLLNAKDQ